jgi:hypothetical protein
MKLLTLLLLPLLTFGQYVKVDNVSHDASFNINCDSIAGVALNVKGSAQVSNLGGNGYELVQADSNGLLTRYIRPYVIYTGLMYQTGIATPTLTELENTTGAVITAFRQQMGVYAIQSNVPLFAQAKTVVFIGKSYTNGYPIQYTTDVSNLWAVAIRTFNAAGTLLQDGHFTSPLSIEIRVYN